LQQRPTPPEGVTITNPTDKMVSVKKKNFSCILYSTYIHVSNLQSAARNQFEIDLQGNIFFTPFQYISSTLSNLVHTGLHTQQSTFRSLAEGLFSAATPCVILVQSTAKARSAKNKENFTWDVYVGVGVERHRSG